MYVKKNIKKPMVKDKKNVNFFQALNNLFNYSDR